jgi:hypothetical protein
MVASVRFGVSGERQTDTYHDDPLLLSDRGH